MKLKSIELVRAMPPKPKTPPGLPLVARNYGVVTAISYGPPLTVTLTLGGSSVPIAGVPCLSSYRPKEGDMVAVDHGDSVLMVLGSTTGTAQGYGLLAHQRVTATSGNFTTTQTQLMSRTVTIGAAREIELAAKVRVSSGQVGDVMTVYFLRDGVVIDSNDYVQPAGAAVPQQPWTTDEGAAAGSHTYAVAAARSNGTGTLNNQATTTKPSLLLITDKGAV